MNTQRARSNILLMLTALIWGAAFVAQSVGMEYLGPFTFNAARFILGGIVLIPCIFMIKKIKGGQQGKTAEELMARRKNGVLGGICCGTILFIASTFQQIGIMDTTVGKTGFITALYIIIVPLLGIFMKKKVAPTIWAGVALATFGMFLLCMTEGGLSVSKGDMYVFVCSICFAFHILMIDYFSPKADGVFMSCIQFFTAGALAFCFTLKFEHPTTTALLSAVSPILYAGIMSCGVAYTLQVVAQKDTDPTVASLILSLESVFSVIAGWLILGQELSSRELSGCVLVFLAIILAQVPLDLIKNKVKMWVEG